MMNGDAGVNQADTLRVVVEMRKVISLSGSSGRLTVVTLQLHPVVDAEGGTTLELSSGRAREGGW